MVHSFLIYLLVISNLILNLDLYKRSNVGYPAYVIIYTIKGHRGLHIPTKDETLKTTCETHIIRRSLG